MTISCKMMQTKPQQFRPSMTSRQWYEWAEWRGWVYAYDVKQYTYDAYGRTSAAGLQWCKKNDWGRIKLVRFDPGWEVECQRL